MSFSTNIFDDTYLQGSCKNTLTPTVLKAVKRIIAIGDIHGDYNLAVESLQLAKVIDNNLKWIAEPKDTIVIQVGDQIDNYRPFRDVGSNDSLKVDLYQNEDLKVMNFFDEIDKKAKKYGGKVISLLGNHELLNATKNFTYVSLDNKERFYLKDNTIEYKGQYGREKAFAPGGPIASNMACTRNSVIIIGSNMFIHAGILPSLITKLDYLNTDSKTKLIYLNNIVRGWLLNKINLNDSQYGNDLNLFINSTLESPFWTRILGEIDKDKPLNSDICRENVDKILEIFKIGHIVIGHTPQYKDHSNNINGTCARENKQNTLYRIDGGFSHSFDKFLNTLNIQILEIIDDNIFNIIKGKRKIT